MRTPRFFSSQTDEPIRWIEQELNQYLRFLHATLYRGLRFESNFLCAKITDLELAAATEVTIANPLRKSNGDKVKPNAWWVYYDSGHREVKQGATWDENTLSFENTHATDDTTVNILVGVL